MPEILGLSKSISGFDPRSIPGCALWLDGADSSTLTLSGANVTQWRDKSGNGYSPTGTSVFPTYSSSSNCVTWNGTANTQLTFPVGISNAVVGTSFSIFIVELRTNGGGDNFIVRGSNTALNSNLLIGHIGPTTLRFAYYGNDLDATVPTYVVGEPRAMGYYEYSKPGRAIYVNGILLASDANASDVLSWSGAILGGSGPVWPAYSGSVFEILMYKPSLTTVQRQQVEGYLAWKWGLETTPSISVPTSISGLGLWLDAADTASMTFSGASVTQWNDKSGNGRNYATYVTPPVYASADGGGVTFSNGQTLYNSDSWSGNGASVDIFVVSTPWAFTQYNDWRTLLRGAGHHIIIEYNSARLGFYNSGFYQFGSLTLGNTKSLLYVTVNSAFVSSAALNGTSALSLAGGTQASWYQPFYWIGGVDQSQPWGTINELLIYSRNLSTTERQDVESYLANKWRVSTPVQVLPTAHPFTSIRPFTRYFNPTDIDTCLLWLDGADTTTMTPSNPSSGTSITSWRDKSSNGVVYSSGVIPNYTAYTAGSPVYVTGGGLNFNPSTPAGGTFTNGVSQSLNAVGGFPLNGTGFTAFAIAKATGTMTSYNAYFTWASAVEFMSFDAFGGAPGAGYGSSLYLDSGGLNTVAASRTLGTSTQIQTLRSSPTGATFYVNGNLSNTTAFSYTQTGNSVASNFWVAGQAPGNRTFSGTIYELLLFNTALSTSQRQQIEGYLAQKWGIQASLPTHPFKTFPPSTALPFSPTNISGCALWLDASDTSSFSFSSGSNISQWRDKSGNGRNGTASNSPVLTLNQQAGLPVVTLASASSQFFDFGNTLNLGTNALTIFFVGKTPLSVNQGFIGKSSSRGLAGRWFLIYEPAVGLYFAVDPAAAGTSNALTTFKSTAGQFAIYSASTDRTPSNYLYTNGRLVGSVAFSNSTNFSTTDKLYVGAYQDSTGLAPQPGFYYNGTIGEIIVYTGILSTAQRQQVEGYLAWKWDLVPRLLYPVITGFSASVNASAWIAYTFTSTSTSGTLVVPAGKTITVDYLLVGGGGGASGYIGGGGGGGYYIYTTSASFTPGTYTISVGTGGTGQVGTNAPSPTGGGNTMIVRSGTTIATGPGGGGAAPIGGLAGSSGPFTGGSYNGGTINSGGGAGAGANGSNGGTNGGNGGTGVQFSITGTARFYGGGGGGGWYTGNVPGTGGAGGGANGATSYNPGSSNNGVNGLGGGGGGATGGGSSIGGNGGSGVAIIRIYS
jgi:hypothetical protein